MSLGPFIKGPIATFFKRQCLVSTSAFSLLQGEAPRVKVVEGVAVLDTGKEEQMVSNYNGST